MVHEEGMNSYNNPFNIEYHEGDNPILRGTGSFNSVGVQEYASPQAGVAATIQILSQPHWAIVSTALLSGNYDLVTAALTTAYSWAVFHPAGNGQAADQILASPLGGK